MALASLVKISPLNISTGTRIDVYASSVDDALVNGLNGVVWEPALVAAPTLAMTLWDGDFTSAVQPGGATIPLKMNVLKQTYAADGCLWTGAPVEIYAEAPGTAWPWALRFKGKISGFSRRDQTLTLTAEVDNEPFAADVLVNTYAGTGGAEGSSNLKDRVKPLVIGWASNVEPVLLDEVNSVYQFSGYGAIEAVTTLYERGSDFGASVGDFASYAALVAATIPAGRWGTCLAAGMVRLGAPAAGVITGDVRGHRVGGTTPRLTGAIITALYGLAGISSSVVADSSLTALDAAVPFPINLVMTDQRSFFDIANELARCCNWQSGVSLLGVFFVARVDFTGSEVLTVNTSGSVFPQVLRSDELDTSIPYYRTVFGAARSWRVHTGDEVAFYYTIEDRGLYNASVTYKGGQVVNLPNQSRWIYENATPSAGNAPPTWPTTSNAWWTNLSGPAVATSINYADGSSIESLKPAEANANITETRTAAAIAGQGDLATSNRATLPFGTNLAVNSEFLLVDPTYGGGVIPVGWQAGWTGDSTNVGTLTFNTRRVQFQDGSFAFARDVTGAPNGTVIDCVSSYPIGLPLGRFAVPVLPGERIVASALIGHQNCAGAYAVIGFYDENGAYVGESAGSTNAANIGAAAYNTLTRSALALVGHQVTVPADGSGGGTGRRRWAVIWFRFSISGSPANPRLVVAAPMLAKVPASQTAIPAYNPGPADRQASFGATTGANLVSPTYGTLSDSGVYTPIGTAAAIAGQAATATNSDYGAVTGTKPPSNATNGAPTGTPVGSITAGDVSSTINSGGGVAANQVATSAILDNAVTGFAQAGSGSTFTHTSFTSLGSVTLTPVSTATKWLVIISGVVTIGDASPGGTFATVRCGSFSDFNVGLRAAPIPFSLSTVVSGLSSAQTLTLQIQASASHGLGDPHVVDSPRIIAIQLTK
jgi:hypothetical protein